MTRVAPGRVEPMTPVEMRACVEEIRARFPAVETVSMRENRVIVRHASASGPVVVKMWSRNDAAGRLRRALGAGSAENEWRNLAMFTRAGLRVPRALGRCVVSPTISGYSEALFMEDLGPCEMATAYLKRVLAAGNESAAAELEERLIEMTRRIVAMGVIDIDHGMVNVLMQESTGALVRVDVELARWVVWPGLFAGWLGEMLGRIVAMYAFAVQPDCGRVTSFASRLAERVKPPRRALAGAGRYARQMMRQQLRETGIDTPLVLPWD